MHSLRAVLLATLILCGFAMAVPTAAAPTPTTPVDVSSSVFQSGENVSTSNGSLGAEISSFMQVSASQTKGTIETELWAARFNNTENKSAKKELVRHQVDDIQTRLDTLHQRKQTLIEERKNGEISSLQYQAEMSEVIGQIRSLEHAINTTKPRAAAVGTNVEDLQQLDERADTVGDPEVAEVARSLNSVSTSSEDNSTQRPGVGNGSGNGTLPSAGNGNNSTIDNGNNSTIGVGNGNNSTIDNGSGNGTLPSAGNGNNSTIDNGNNSTIGVGDGNDTTIGIGDGNNSIGGNGNNDGNGSGLLGDGLSITN